MTHKSTLVAHKYVAGSQIIVIVWVGQQASPERGQTMRLSVDVPLDNHARFKAFCALRKTKIGAEINAFIQHRLNEGEDV